MGIGKRVRISRPPPGKRDWEDKKATVVTLVPEAKNPLEYTIRLDGDDETEYNVAADCLEPLKIQEEVGEGAFRWLLVNDLMYCQDHRLEVCGSCGVDHRMINYQMEITTTHDFSVVDKLLEEMTRIGAPARQAPSKKSKSKSPMANKAIFRPVVNEHLTIINEGFDPASLDAWPSGMPTYPAAMGATAFVPAEIDIPELAKLPVRQARESIVASAYKWDHFLNIKSVDEPMARLLLQDEAQSQVLSLDLMLPIRSVQVGNRMVPVFVVRWARSLASSMTDALAVAGTMEQGTRMDEIKVEVDEIDLVAALLKQNGERLDPCFVRKVEKFPDLLSVSVLTPISEAAQITFYKSLGDYCYQCGTSGVSVQKCSQCLQASYCSRECQVKNWSFHKKTCTKR